MIRLPNEGPQVFNNADSFGQAFDETWRQLSHLHPAQPADRQDLLAAVLERLADHPFVQSSPERALEVAEFRIRLLGL